jgi:hypothetical protein
VIVWRLLCKKTNFNLFYRIRARDKRLSAPYIISMSYARLFSAVLMTGTIMGALALPAFAQTASPAASHPSVAGAPSQITKPIYPWKTEASEKENEQGQKILSHCSSKNIYDNGILLLIAENTQNQRRLALHFPQDKLTLDETYDLQWQVDRLDQVPVKAIAASPRILAIAIDDPMTQEIARGNMLFLRGPNDTLVFDLRGVYDAIVSVQNCLRAQGVVPQAKAVDASNVSRALSTPVGATAPQPQPAAPVVAPTSKPVPAPTPAAQKPDPKTTQTAPKAMAPLPPSTTPTTTLTSDNQLVPMLQGIFTRANVKPQRLVVIPEKERDNKPFDAIWTLGHLFVGVKTERPVPYQALMQIAATYTGRLQQLCGGEFLAEAGEVEKRATHYVMPVEVACSPVAKDGKNTVAALLFALDTNALRITFVEAPEKYGAQAIQARDRVSAQYK